MKAGIANYIRIMLMVLPFSFFVTGLSASTSEESLKSLMNLPNDSLKLQILFDLSRRNIDAPIELTYLDILLKEASRQTNIKYQVLAYRNKVRYYYNLLAFDSMTYYKEQAEPFLLKNRQYDVLIELESMVINTHAYRGEYEFALVKANKMYNEARQLNDENGLIAACENLAFAYHSSQRYKESIRCYKEALSLIEKQGGRYTYRMQLALTMTDAMFSCGEIDSAKVSLAALKHLLQTYELGDDNSLEVRVRLSEYWLWLYARYADVAIREKRLDKAIPYLDKAEQYARAGVNNIFFDLLYYTYVDYYLEIGDCERALEYEKKAAEVALQYEGRYTPKMIHVQARIYEKKKNFKTASSLFRQELSLSDSINRQRFSTQASQLRSIYEVDKLEAEGRREQLSVNQLVIMKASLSVLALVLALFILVFYKYKRKLSVATRYAEDSDDRTSEFLDSMSRAIKVSLAEISALSYRLINETEVDDRRQYAKKIKVTNDTLQHVIFNVLDVSKIESDKMKFNYAEVYLPGVMEEVQSMAARYKSSLVTFRVIPGPEIFFECDLTRLMQILDNLMRYMVSNTLEGDVCVGYNAGSGNVNFTISNTGLVLSDEDRRMLFDRRVQAGFKLQDMGLDLVVCKELIFKMGGDISVSSGKEKGTVLYFALPLKENV